MPRTRPARARLGAAVGLAIVALSACSSAGGGATTTEAAGLSAPAAKTGSAPVPASTPSPKGEPTVVASVASVEPSAPASAAITTTTVEPGAPAACTLLTVDEVGFVTGGGRVFGEGAAAAPQETPYGAHTACTWTSTKGSDATVRISVWDDDSAFDDARVQVGADGDLADVGERAFASTLSSVYAVAGGHTVFVQFQDLRLDPAANLAMSTMLAQLVADRL